MADHRTDRPIDDHLMDTGVYGDHYVMSAGALPVPDRTTQLARRRRSSNHFIWQNTIPLIGFFAPHRRGVFTRRATWRDPVSLIVWTSSRWVKPTNRQPPQSTMKYCPAAAAAHARAQQFDGKLSRSNVAPNSTKSSIAVIWSRWSFTNLASWYRVSDEIRHCNLHRSKSTKQFLNIRS